MKFGGLRMRHRMMRFPDGSQLPQQLRFRSRYPHPFECSYPALRRRLTARPDPPIRRFCPLHGITRPNPVREPTAVFLGKTF